jgi:hypothetical protein
VFSDEPLEIHRCDKPTGRQAKASWLFPELGQIDASQPPAERLKQLAALMTHPENGRFTRTIVNRLWHRLMGHGIVHPVDAMQSEPWNSDLLDFLATDLADHQYDLKRTLALICSSKAYQSVAEVLKEDADRNYTYAGPRSKRLTAEQFTDAIWQITGAAPRKFDAPIKREGSAPRPEQALAAKWIWSGDQKAKAAASGETVSFRTRFHLAALPQTASAVLTCDNGFKLWVNQKEIARSDQWETPVAVDLLDALRTGENEIVIVGTNGGQGPNLAGLWMQGQLRFADGSLQTLNSGPAWLWNSAVPRSDGLFTPDPGHWKPAVEVNGAAWQGINDALQALLVENANGGGPMVRAALMKSDFLMRALGRPNREQIVSMRPNDLTTLEAMDLNNGQILTTRLETGARAILQKQAGAGSAALVSWLYAFAYSRAPSPAELALATEALGSPPNAAGLQDLLWVLLVQPEFQMVR